MRRILEEDNIRLESRDKDIDEVFWQDLLNEGIEDHGVLGVEDVDVLANQLGYLASSPK